MSDFMWPPENVKIYIDLSNDLIFLEDYVKNSNNKVPAPAFLLYEDLEFTFNEWKDLIDSLRSLSNTELLDVEDHYIKDHPEEFDEC